MESRPNYLPRPWKPRQSLFCSPPPRLFHSIFLLFHIFSSAGRGDFNRLRAIKISKIFEFDIRVPPPCWAMREWRVPSHFSNKCFFFFCLFRLQLFPISDAPSSCTCTLTCNTWRNVTFHRVLHAKVWLILFCFSPSLSVSRISSVFLFIYYIPDVWLTLWEIDKNKKNVCNTENLSGFLSFSIASKAFCFFVFCKWAHYSDTCFFFSSLMLTYVPNLDNNNKKTQNKRVVQLMKRHFSFIPKISFLFLFAFGMPDQFFFFIPFFSTTFRRRCGWLTLTW